MISPDYNYYNCFVAFCVSFYGFGSYPNHGLQPRFSKVYPGIQKQVWEDYSFHDVEPSYGRRLFQLALDVDRVREFRPRYSPRAVN